jgi:hypothetical protein
MIPKNGTIGGQKVVLTILFGGVSLITLNALLSGERFIYEEFIHDILLDHILCSHEQFHALESSEDHRHNPRCEASTPCSPNLSPCDFWLFAVLKHKMKDRAFQRVDEIATTVDTIGEGLTSEDLQSVLFNWIERLEWVIEHRGEYYMN